MNQDYRTDIDEIESYIIPPNNIEIVYLENEQSKTGKVNFHKSIIKNYAICITKDLLFYRKQNATHEHESAPNLFDNSPILCYPNLRSKTDHNNLIVP